MSKIIKLHTYTALIAFRSVKLGKRFEAGDEIKAPESIGSVWVQSNLATKKTNHKTPKP